MKPDGLHRGGQVSQGYIARPCLQKTRKKMTNRRWEEEGEEEEEDERVEEKGRGKTNFLPAIFLLYCTRSSRLPVKMSFLMQIY